MLPSLIDPEDGSDTFLRNVGRWYSSNPHDFSGFAFVTLQQKPVNRLSYYETVPL
jgi:hypothetical protein